ncbi:hypothetical protein TNIN_357581 [Trichonephila inaurata madagascariensis]|uniref:Uncharacterized protein n=1 Tax=Trichonephila inaurata madagascariensis TaxID=2747483 RepID=A0A8X6XLR1_9ARAC|nr:hypothetical protein TNIN_357581 [Trichonephila inaurata madagascariensis]
MSDKLPEPPMHVSTDFALPGNISPPLPPPPPDDDNLYHENYNLLLLPIIADMEYLIGSPRTMLKKL